MANDPIRIRRGRPADLDALLALEERCFRCDLISRRMLRAHLSSPRSILLVATRGGAVIGDALVFLRADSPAARLYSIAVDPSARGLGLGGKLLAAAEAAARESGARALRLEVDTRNATAIALYESRGYRRFAEKREYYEDGGTAWRYEKALDLKTASRRAGRAPRRSSPRETPRARGTPRRT